MNNGHEKLIAKIQHFYDVLMKHLEQYGAEALITNEPTSKHKCGLLAEEYVTIAAQYQEVFKDFLYNGEES